MDHNGLFVALNYFSHLTLCLSEKMRRCFKIFDMFEKTYDFFHSLAVTDYHYRGVRHMAEEIIIIVVEIFGRRFYEKSG